MILIADSGSTKCDWALIDEKGKRIDNFNTMGLNPYFHDEETVEAALKENASLMAVSDKITHIFFYGAGSSTHELCEHMKRGLQRVFIKADILVDHDLLGAAMSTYDGRPGITCILGTGSNSCHFDGKEIYEEIPSLAYILGDESSGSWYGKILLQEYFYKKLPADLRAAFIEKYNPDKDTILMRVYQEPNANVYLASYMKFLGENHEHPHVREWIYKGMKHFSSIHVQCFKNYREVPVHFIGSVGHIFQDILKRVAEEDGWELGTIIRRPLDGLVDYHVKYKLPSLV